MTEIPEHLRKRAEEARAKAAGAKGDSSSSPVCDNAINFDDAKEKVDRSINDGKALKKMNDLIKFSNM